MAAGLAMALASNRVLLVRWSTNEACRCAADGLFLQPDYPFFAPAALLEPLLADARITHTVPTFHRIGMAFEWLHCANVRDALGDWGIVFVYHASGHRYFAPVVLHNPHHSEFFAAAFPNDSFAATALSFLFRPVPEVLRIARPCDDVGVHVRAMIPYGSIIFDDIAASFARELNAVLRTDSAPRRVFVASDSVAVLEPLQRRVPANVVLDAERDVKPQSDQYCPELRRALADLVTLSRCTMLVGTRDSRFAIATVTARSGRLTTSCSFSTVAAAWKPQPASARFVSVCLRECAPALRQRSVSRTRNHSLCYWEWRHTRLFQCQFGSPQWRTGPEAQCCADNLCDECLYHRSGFMYDFFGAIPYRPLWRLLMPAALCIALVVLATRRVASHPLAWLSAAALCAIVMSVLLVLSVNVLQHGHVLGAYRLLWG